MIRHFLLRSLFPRSLCCREKKKKKKFTTKSDTHYGKEITLASTLHVCKVALVVLSSVAILWASLVAHAVKNLPVVQETWVQPLGWEDSPGGEHGHPLHPGESSWTEELGGLQSLESQRVVCD